MSGYRIDFDDQIAFEVWERSFRPIIRDEGTDLCGPLIYLDNKTKAIESVAELIHKVADLQRTRDKHAIKTLDERL